MDLLRILTPEEVTALTAASENAVKVPLTELLNLKRDGQDPMSVFQKDTDEDEAGAKILPFNKAGDESDTAEESDREPEEISAHPNIIKLITDKFFEIEKQRLNDTLTTNGEQNNTSTFILKEKRRFMKNQHILKSKEIYQLYLSNSEVEISKNHDVSNDDLAASNKSGVLVNKKQF